MCKKLEAWNIIYVFTETTIIKTRDIISTIGKGAWHSQIANPIGKALTLPIYCGLLISETPQRREEEQTENFVKAVWLIMSG